MRVKYVLLKTKRKFLPSKFSSDNFKELLELQGIKIGKGTYFFGPTNTVIDIQRPALLEIGEYCKITAGVKILTHDYSRSVLRMKYGDIIGEARKTIIKNNVFIGIDSIILPRYVHWKQCYSRCWKCCVWKYSGQCCYSRQSSKNN